MTREQATPVSSSLATVLPQDAIEAKAAAFGVVKRRRKIQVYPLVLAVVLAYQVGATRSISTIRRSFKRLTGLELTRNAFYKRFTPPLAKLLRDLVVSAMEAASGSVGIPAGVLSQFRELMLIDSTVLRLHEHLAKSFGGCRTNHSKAAAKLHVVYCVQKATASEVKLTAEKVNDRRPWTRIGKWVGGSLLLFDLGYFGFQLFDRIEQNGGAFISRLKSNANVRIVALNRKHRGQSRSVVGLGLREVLPYLQREALDVMVEVSFLRRVYGGKRSRDSRTFRVVAVLDQKTGRYHTYMTNLSPEALSAQDVARTYALRWQVEILFKALKHHGHLDHLPSRKKAVVECLIWASILALLASQALYREIRKAAPPDRHLPLLAWAANFAVIAADLPRILLRPDPEEDQLLFRLLLREAVDPNRNRADRSSAGLIEHAAA